MSEDRLKSAFESDDSPPGLPGAADIFGGGAPVPPRRQQQALLELQTKVAQLDGLLDVSLVPQEDGTYRYKRFLLTGTGLICPEDMTLEEYEEIGRVILNIGSSLAWLLGDWVAWGEHFQWGETYRLLAAEFDYEVDTLYTYAWVCKKVSIRNRDLSFGHHRLVVKMSEEEQSYWLQLAAGKGWKVAELKEAIRKSKETQPLPENVEVNPLKLLNLREQRSAFRKEFNDTLDTLARAGSNPKYRDMARGKLSNWRKILEQWEQALDE